MLHGGATLDLLMLLQAVTVGSGFNWSSGVQEGRISSSHYLIIPSKMAVNFLVGWEGIQHPILLLNTPSSFPQVTMFQSNLSPPPLRY